MTKFSGYILDTYDDENGEVLRSIIDASKLPSFMKTASRLTSTQIGHLPDDQFALILLDGSHKFKKYATLDKGNTTLSVLYFLKQAHILPPEMAKVAANNLIVALDFHDLPIPEDLLKVALSPTTVPGKSQKPYPKAGISQIQYPGILEEPKEFHENPQLGKHDAAWDDVKERTNVEGTPGSNFMELPAFPQKEKYKTAGQTYNSLTRESEGSAQQYFNNPAQMRQQITRESPYFYISNSDWASPSPTTESTIPEHTLLNGQFPIDGYDQVKMASSYFGDNWKNIGFRDRHIYCVKLASRMDELNIPIPENIERYGSSTYASDVESYLETRRLYVSEEAYPALNLLIEKRAQVSPGVFAEALAEFDRMNDLNWHWDSKISDPWYSTFGPSIEKIAEDNWCWYGVGTRIDEEDLEELARNAYDRIVHNFGAHFAREFAKSPKAVFSSLPEPNKLIMARFASDKYSGTLE